MSEKVVTQNKVVSWLKGSRSKGEVTASGNQVKMASAVSVQPVVHEENNEQQDMAADQPNDNNFFPNRNQLDKTNLDLVSATENIIKKRQLELLRWKDTEEQLAGLKADFDRLTATQKKQDYYISELEGQIRDSNEKILNKQMAYDQLMEDYEGYQNSSRQENEDLTYKVAEEEAKYTKLVEAYNDYKHETVKLESDYQEKIRRLEVEKQKVSDRHENILLEKNHLMQVVQEFTNRMSVPAGEGLEGKTASVEAKSEES